MTTEIAQGDILSVERINTPILVVSKTFFNRTEQVIACPVLRSASEDPLHIPIIAMDMQGIALCEQMKLLDLRIRGYKKLTELKMEDVMNITDAIQGIFDYYPFGK
ncbi:type II toxin-antitoxin system PemK/MazF family toxin [Kineothrix sp. MB12-C1]|uniref:type II toxin-antitoxin system PemK/MazF family toxin n=1 Tax=Kineothrix sp. MB12-C1 TaxID=3070215 RepID=UPI0027D23000|nr:type II toxin-antitoxin system PemK/MazF family toxin [Kineothrix sp. MB12-C1]WMC92273.1 type II toxin-antitoxin system PemK/MazF family toxin [Kineothrix sp. MB12-C1]